jgi:hypothetical protein
MFGNQLKILKLKKLIHLSFQKNKKYLQKNNYANFKQPMATLGNSPYKLMSLFIHAKQSQIYSERLRAILYQAVT